MTALGILLAAGYVATVIVCACGAYLWYALSNARAMSLACIVVGLLVFVPLVNCVMVGTMIYRYVVKVIEGENPWAFKG